MFFAGGFTEGDEPGMALFELNQKGDVSLINKFYAGPSPVYFCFSKQYSLIYALDEVMDFNGHKAGGITTLKFDPSTGLSEKLAELVIPHGGPCHISITRDSSFLLTASYSSSSVAVVKLDSDGIPESVTDSIRYFIDSLHISHPHMIAQDPAGKHIYLTDLGLDRILIYDIDKATGKLVAIPGGNITLPEGSGPRHFVFNSTCSKMYVINELGSTIMVFNVAENGLIDLAQTLPSVREGFNGKNSCAEILIGESGEFLYGSNRGENTIVVFKIDENGMLSLAGHSNCGGDWPRNFVIDPTGRFLLSGNQKSDWISVFRINKNTGLPEGPLSRAEMKAPAYLEFWR